MNTAASFRTYVLQRPVPPKFTNGRSADDERPQISGGANPYLPIDRALLEFCKGSPNFWPHSLFMFGVAEYDD
jgi:hypothetical protein